MLILYQKELKKHKYRVLRLGVKEWTQLSKKEQAGRMNEKNTA